MPSSYTPPATAVSYPITADKGGTGVVNGVASTLTFDSTLGYLRIGTPVQATDYFRFALSCALHNDTGLELASNRGILWTNDNFFDTPDLRLVRAAANTLALRNGTNGQTLVISRTYTDASNYAQVAQVLTGSTLAFTVQEAGTGVGTVTAYSFDKQVVIPVGYARNILFTGTASTGIGGPDGNVVIYANGTSYQFLAAYAYIPTNLQVVNGIVTGVSGVSFAPSVGGTIFTHFTTVSTTHTDGTEDDLYSNTTPGGGLNANGASYQQVEQVNFVSSVTAARRLKKYFAGTLIFDSGALTLAAGGDFTLVTNVIRESSSIVRCSVSVTSTSASTVPYTTYTRITGLTLSATQVLKTTGIASGTGAASGDINDLLEATTWNPAP